MSVQAGINEARRLVGVHEIGTTNRSPVISPWERRCGFDGGPWCAAFAWHIAGVGGVAIPSDLPTPGYCPSIEAWARKHGRLLPAHQARPGDFITFGWNNSPIAEHVGVYVGPGDLTIEGNTSSSSGGSQSNGGEVAIKHRNFVGARYCIKLHDLYGGKPVEAPAKRPATSKHPTIKSGSKGEAVRIAQGLLHVPADGIFGPHTRGAVVAFQKSHGLAADGVVGPATWGKLLLTVHR